MSICSHRWCLASGIRGVGRAMAARISSRDLATLVYVQGILTSNEKAHRNLQSRSSEVFAAYAATADHAITRSKVTRARGPFTCLLRSRRGKVSSVPSQVVNEWFCDAWYQQQGQLAQSSATEMHIEAMSAS